MCNWSGFPLNRPDLLIFYLAGSSSCWWWERQRGDPSGCEQRLGQWHCGCLLEEAMTQLHTAQYGQAASQPGPQGRQMWPTTQPHNQGHRWMGWRSLCCHIIYFRPLFAIFEMFHEFCSDMEPKKPNHSYLRYPIFHAVKLVLYIFLAYIFALAVCQVLFSVPCNHLSTPCPTLPYSLRVHA